MHDAVGMAAAAPYRPAAQVLHSDALDSEYWPTGHCTAVALVEPAGQEYPAAHGPLHNDDTSPEALPYRPGSHGPVHCDTVSPVVAP